MKLNSGQLSLRFSETFDFYRGLILETFEQEVGDQHNWPIIRSRVLRCMGDRGLEGKLRELFGLPPRNTMQSNDFPNDREGA